jgi:hypothetical protein
VKFDRVTAVSRTDKFGRFALYFSDGEALKPCLNAEGATSSPLAFEAMTHWNPNWLAFTDQL